MPKFDINKPVTTRDGRPARIICTDRNHEKPIVALISDPYNREVVYYRYADGKMSRDREVQADLINVVTKTSTYQNVYNATGCNPLGNTESPTKDAANEVAGESTNHTGYIRRDYEDGVLVKTELENL